MARCSGCPSGVDRLFDDIVEFAELEQFIDNQVKFYSSGMYVRLGFAVAVNVDPDVLVVDEVLAVGDERFQRKCMDRIRSFQTEGRTILFVSHSPDQVRAICDRAVVLSGWGDDRPRAPRARRCGSSARRLLEAGDALTISDHEPRPNHLRRPYPRPGVRHRSGRGPGGGCAGRNPAGEDRYGHCASSGHGERPYLLTGEPLTVRVEFEASSATDGVVFVLEMRDSTAAMLLRTDTDQLDAHYDVPEGPGAIEFSFDSIPFLDGAYYLVVGIQSKLGGVQYDWQEPAGPVRGHEPGKGHRVHHPSLTTWR